MPRSIAAPRLGVTPRAIAAAVALLLVSLSVSGWSHSDAPRPAYADRA